MAHRSGYGTDSRRPRPAQPSLPPEAAPQAESRLLAGPLPGTTQVRIRPLPPRRQTRFRLRWYDILCVAMILAAAVALYVRR